MSKVWSEKEKAKMRAEALAHMSDRCFIQDKIKATNGVGDDVSVWASRSQETPCGFEMKAGGEYIDNKFVTTHDATIRLPYDTFLTSSNKIKLVSFRGEPVDLLFEVVSPAQMGISAITAKLKRIET